MVRGDLGRYDRTMTDQPVDLPKRIGAPATRALAAAGFTTLSQLAGTPVSELQALHGVGPKALRILQEELAVTGQSLG
jgi:hypothetical protein